MNDLDDRLRGTLRRYAGGAQPAHGPDPDDVEQRSRHRAQRRRAATTAGVAGALAVVVMGGVLVFRDRTPSVDSGVALQPSTTVGASATTVGGAPGGKRPAGAVGRWWLPASSSGWTIEQATEVPASSPDGDDTAYVQVVRDGGQAAEPGGPAIAVRTAAPVDFPSASETVRGHPAQVSEEEGRQVVMWVEDDRLVQVIGTGVDAAVVRQVAEGVTPGTAGSPGTLGFVPEGWAEAASGPWLAASPSTVLQLTRPGLDGPVQVTAAEWPSGVAQALAEAVPGAERADVGTWAAVQSCQEGVECKVTWSIDGITVEVAAAGPPAILDTVLSAASSLQPVSRSDFEAGTAGTAVTVVPEPATTTSVLSATTTIGVETTSPLPPMAMRYDEPVAGLDGVQLRVGDIDMDIPCGEVEVADEVTRLCDAGWRIIQAPDGRTFVFGATAEGAAGSSAVALGQDGGVLGTGTPVLVPGADDVWDRWWSVVEVPAGTVAADLPRLEVRSSGGQVLTFVEIGDMKGG